MAKKYTFERRNDEDLIRVEIGLGTASETYPLTFALDTGATHTTIDFTAFIMAGFDLQKFQKPFYIETSGGIIEAQRHSVPFVKSLGIEREKFEVTVYDFLRMGITSDYDGVLGLDFFKDTKLHIDFINNEIWLETE